MNLSALTLAQALSAHIIEKRDCILFTGSWEIFLQLKWPNAGSAVGGLRPHCCECEELNRRCWWKQPYGGAPQQMAYTHWDLVLGARSHSFSHFRRIIRNHSICLCPGDDLYLWQNYNNLLLLAIRGDGYGHRAGNSCHCYVLNNQCNECILLSTPNQYFACKYWMSQSFYSCEHSCFNTCELISQQSLTYWNSF